eukprot:3756392-Lingulodinium_polyedra.AAC.1
MLSDAVGLFSGNCYGSVEGCLIAVGLLPSGCLVVVCWFSKCGSDAVWVLSGRCSNAARTALECYLTAV